MGRMICNHSGGASLFIIGEQAVEPRKEEADNREAKDRYVECHPTKEEERSDGECELDHGSLVI